MSAWYEPEPENDGYIPTIQEVGAAVVLVIGAVAFLLTRRAIRTWTP